jgi:septum formation protein
VSRGKLLIRRRDQPPRLILASASPRRRELLTQFGYNAEIRPADIAEIFPPHLTVAETTLLNARLKANAVAEEEPDALVLAADTLVALDQEIFGKPQDRAEAFRMLGALSGRVHCVFSGVWLKRGSKSCGFIDKSRVKFRKLSIAEIEAYIARVDPMDKAGAYAVQESSERIISRIDGSITNVMGLPMEKLEQTLQLFDFTTGTR